MMQPIQRRKSVIEKSNSFAGRELFKNELPQLQREVASEESSPHGSQGSLRNSSFGQDVQLRTNLSDRTEKRGRRKSTSDIPVSIHGLWPSKSLHSVCEDDFISDSSTGQQIGISKEDIMLLTNDNSDASSVLSHNTPPSSPLLQSRRTNNPARLPQSPNSYSTTLSVPIVLEATPKKAVPQTESSHLVPSTSSDTPPDPCQSSSPSPTPPSIPTEPETIPEVLVPETESSPMVPYLERYFPVERHDKGVFVVCGSLRLFNTKLDDICCIVTGFNTSTSYSDPTTSLSELII